MATHVLLHPVLSPAADRAKKRKEINEPTFSFLSIRNKKKKKTHRKTWLSKITKRKLLFTLVCKAETRKLKNVHKITTRFCAYRCLYYVITAASASHETPTIKKKTNEKRRLNFYERPTPSIHHLAKEVCRCCHFPRQALNFCFPPISFYFLHLLSKITTHRMPLFSGWMKKKSAIVGSNV